MTVAAQREDIADTDAAAQRFALPTIVGVEADAEETDVGVSGDVETTEGGTFARRAAVNVTGAPVVAGLKLVVADLEVLVLVVVLPPGTVEGETVGEVTAQRVVLDGDVRDGTPAVIARDVGEVKQEVRFHREELAARNLDDEGHGGLGNQGHGLGSRDGVLYGRNLFHHGGCGFLEEQHHAGGTQLGEVLLEQALPEGTTLDALQRALQECVFVAGQVAVAELLHDGEVGIGGATHHGQQQAVVLGDGFSGEVLLVHGNAQARA